MASEAGAVKLEAIATDTQNLRAKAGVNITVEKVETPTAAQGELLHGQCSNWNYYNE